MDRLLEKDLTLKLLSLAMALALWVSVSGRDNPGIGPATFQVAVEPVGLQEGLTIQKLEPRTVRVTVRGPRWRVRELSSEDFRASLDLSRAGPGRTFLPVRVYAPPGVETLNLNPSQVAVVVGGEAGTEP